MADTDAARIGDVKGGLEAAKTDANRRLRRDGSNVDMTPEQAAAFRAAIGAGGGGGSGDVVGPAGASDGALAQFDGATGKLLKSGPILGQPNGVATLGADGKVPAGQLPASGAGGDVTGPASATADAPAVFSGTTGKVIKVGAFPVLSVAGLTGAIAAAALKAALSLVKGDVGLGNVDNTSDANKPVSTAQQAALDLKAEINDTIASVTTSRNLAATDNGKVLEVNSATDVTLTVPSSLPAGFNCIVSQIGAGKAIIAAGSGASVNAFGGPKTAGQWAELSVRVRTTAGAAVVSGGVA